MRALVAESKAKLVKGRARAEALLRLIERRKQRITEDFYDIGEALRELYRKQLFRALGYATFEAMLAARRVFKRTQARKLIAMVEHMPRDVALTLGQEKAYALVTYTAATPEPDAPAELVEDDALIQGKRLSKLSGRALETAAKRVRAAKRAARKKVTSGEVTARFTRKEAERASVP